MRRSSTLALWLGGAALPAALSAATLVVANESEATVSLLDLERGAVVATLATGHGPHEVAISPDGGRALVSDYGTRAAPGSTLTLLDVAAAKPVRTIALGDYRRPHGVVWLDSRGALVTAEESRALLEVDVESGTVLRALATGQEVSHLVAVAPGGALAYVAPANADAITEVDLAARRATRTLRAGREPDGMGWTAVAVAGTPERSAGSPAVRRRAPSATYPRRRPARPRRPAGAAGACGSGGGGRAGSSVCWVRPETINARSSASRAGSVATGW